jgi:hypothetical protein
MNHEHKVALEDSQLKSANPQIRKSAMTMTGPLDRDCVELVRWRFKVTLKASLRSILLETEISNMDAYAKEYLPRVMADIKANGAATLRRERQPRWKESRRSRALP